MTIINKLIRPKEVFILSILTSVFWCVGTHVNVYYFAVVGGIFEFLWLPMIVLLFVLPILSFFFFVKEKFNLKSLYLYSFLIVLATILFMTLKE